MTWREALREHAAKELPRECCGLVILVEGEEVYQPCTNLSQGLDEFALDPRDYLRIRKMGKIVGVAHSHPSGPAGLTEYDRASQRQEPMPWHVLDMRTGDIYTELPSEQALPYVGRKFIWGVQDCYTLARDYYAREMGVHLPQFHRAEGWEKLGHSLYTENFEACGFRRVDSPQAGDAVLMQIFAPFPNHVAIYMGDNTILHHLNGRLSKHDVYGGYYRKVATHYLRHRCRP